MSGHDPHIVDAVRRMRGEGVRTFEIAMAVGLTPGAVRKLCSTRGIGRRTAARLDLPVGVKLMGALQAEAGRREVRFDQFVRGLLLNIVKDNLYTAILDDDGK